MSHVCSISQMKQTRVYRQGMPLPAHRYEKLTLDAARVMAVAIGCSDAAVRAVNDQLAAVTGGLRSGYCDGLGLRGLDDGCALSTGRDNGETVGSGGNVDVLRHDY